MMNVYFFFVKIFLIDAHLFYEYFVRQSVRQNTKIIFLSSINNRIMIIFVKIYLMNEHLLHRYFVCVVVNKAKKDM